MDKVYEELEDAKAEIGKLRAEYRVKLELSEGLKRSQTEQLIKIKELNSKLEKQAQELNEKADEISDAKQILEVLKSNLKEKEAIIKSISSANTKLRVDCDEKLKICEDEKRNLVFSLEEANANKLAQEQTIRSLKVEIEDLKEFVSVSQKKRLQAEKMVKTSRESRQRDDTVFKLEEENKKLEEELKWKKEQFNHLVEAHGKLRDKLRASEKEWEGEKSSFVDEISAMQTDLDSQIRITEGLQSQLSMCNQALAHEESWGKSLEVKLSESKTSFDNVFGELQETKSKLLGGTGKGDKSKLLGRTGKGDKENQGSKLPFQEIQEYQIQDAGITSSSLTKLRNKLKSLEQIHRDCLRKLKAKEAEWSSQLGKMIEDQNWCKCELESKDELIEELRIELLVLKTELTEAARKLTDEKIGHEEKESSASEKHLKEEMLKMKNELKKVYKALDRSKEELDENLCEGNEIQFELEVWKSIAERLKANLEETQQMRREVEAALLAQVTVEVTLKEEKDRLLGVVEEKDRRLDELEKKLYGLSLSSSSFHNHLCEIINGKENASPTTSFDSLM